MMLVNKGVKSFITASILLSRGLDASSVRSTRTSLKGETRSTLLVSRLFPPSVSRREQQCSEGSNQKTCLGFDSCTELCISHDCDGNEVTNEDCSCEVTLNGETCETCAYCKDKTNTFDCSNVSPLLSPLLCEGEDEEDNEDTGDEDEAEEEAVEDEEEEEEEEDGFGSTAAPDEQFPTLPTEMEGEKDTRCEVTDSDNELCLTRVCEGSNLSADECTCTFTLNGDECDQCSLCPADPSAVSLDCTNLGESDLVLQCVEDSDQEDEVQDVDSVEERNCQTTDEGFELCAERTCDGSDCTCEFEVDGTPCDSCEVCSDGSSLAVNCENIQDNLIVEC